MIENQKRAEYRDKLFCSSYILIPVLKSNPILNLMPCPSLGPKRFGPDQKQLFTTEFHILKHLQNIWFCPKQFGRVQYSFRPTEDMAKVGKQRYFVSNCIGD